MEHHYYRRQGLRIARVPPHAALLERAPDGSEREVVIEIDEVEHYLSEIMVTMMRDIPKGENSLPCDASYKILPQTQ